MFFLYLCCPYTKRPHHISRPFELHHMHHIMHDRQPCTCGTIQIGKEEQHMAIANLSIHTNCTNMLCGLSLFFLFFFLFHFWGDLIVILQEVCQYHERFFNSHLHTAKKYTLNSFCRQHAYQTIKNEVLP